MRNTPGPDVWKDRQQTYFEEKKKGEMNEIKNLLNGIINEPDQKKGREVIKKIIGYMTLGIDASPIFAEMCRASFTNDEIQKKMIYFYLTTYAQQHPDLAVMAINTFKKDCKHSSSKIRGMALRNLCSFKSSDYIDSVLPILREALLDHEPYVKKTAILGCLKLFYFNPRAITNDQQIKQTLASMIRQTDPLISQNALVALNEIKAEDGGIPMTTKLTMYLLNRLKQYNQWGQTIILEFIHKYQPKNENQRFDIMNLLEDRLKHSSTALVLAAIKIFMKFTKHKQSLFQSVLERIKSPLITLMSSSENTGTFETTYVILEHIYYAIKTLKGMKIFEKDFKYFYFKADEPTYIKRVKIQILTELASENNLGDMLNQLNEYVNDIDNQISRQSIQSLTAIALRLREVTKALLKNLSQFYKSAKPHVINEVIISFQKILRKFPKQFSEIKDVLLIGKDLIVQSQSKIAYIWILGNFGTRQRILQAPYILESIISTEQQFIKLPSDVKQMLLTSVVTLFLKRAPETFKIMIKLFDYILSNDNTLIDLKDRASFYYRAMQANIQQFERGFAQISNQIQKFQPIQTDQKNYEQFNTLCLIYRKAEFKFTKDYQYFSTMRNKELGITPETQPTNTPAQTNNNVNQGQNIMDMNFNPSLTAIEADDLLENITLSPQQFEQKWNSFQQGSSITRVIQNTEILSEQQIENLFKMWRIYTMASAQEDNIIKFYLYACHNKASYFCLELEINKNTSTLTLNTKCHDEQLAGFISKYVEDFLHINEII